ncbi:protein mono-ADP-ribosyltransferase PARP14-like isoform X2 [Haliotis rufescens]|nr:protein mono-ADP-ribosyltransferase PARP14-like isoform X2 [Haliotis rufescens]
MLGTVNVTRKRRDIHVTMTTDISVLDMGKTLGNTIGNKQLDISCNDKQLDISCNDKQDQAQEGPDGDSGIQTLSSASTLTKEPTYPVVNDINRRSTFKQHVIVCSGSGSLEAEAIQSSLNVDTGPVSITVCNDTAGFFNNISPSASDTALYIVVDSPMCDILMKGRRLPDAVYDFFEEFAQSSKVYLKNILPQPEHWRYDGLRCQLPQDCVREYKEIHISCGQTPVTEGDRVTVESESGAGSMESTDNVDDDDIDIDEDGGDDDADAEEYSSMEESGVVSPTEHIQIGSNCTMNITRQPTGELLMRQDGTQNTMNVQIVPRESTSKVVVVITPVPTDPELDRILLRQMDGQKDVININLQSQNAQVVRFSPGSVIVEIDLQPGQKVGPEWIKSLLGKLFNQKVKSCIPQGTRLKVDIKSNVCLPGDHLDQSLSKMSSDIHTGCVAREKYDELAKELDELRRSNTSQRLSVRLVSGDIKAEKTDVIVNSTNTNLKMLEGDISKSILTAAGSSVQKECSHKYPSGLEIGVVAKTDGGSLACHNIYHVVLPNIWNSHPKVAQECFRSILGKILQQADNDGHRCISIPPLGTGHLRYTPNIVAKLMFEVCRSFRSKFLMEVRLVVLPKFADVHKAFTDVYKECEHEELYAEKAPMASEICPSTSKASEEACKQKEIKKSAIEISWISGDMADQEVDAVVCSTNPNLNLKNGVLSVSILKKAKGDIEEELNANYPQGIGAWEVAFTGGGQSPWKQIYFTTLKNWDTSEELKNSFVRMITKCLQLASESQLSSIAFPLLGTKRQRYPCDLVSEWLNQAILLYATANPETSLVEAMIVVRPEDQTNPKC